MSQVQLLIVLQLVGLAFNAGVLVTVLRNQGSDIKRLKKNDERHDREIGVMYGHAKLPREVRG